MQTKRTRRLWLLDLALAAIVGVLVLAASLRREKVAPLAVVMVVDQQALLLPDRGMIAPVLDGTLASLGPRDSVKIILVRDRPHVPAAPQSIEAARALVAGLRFDVPVARLGQGLGQAAKEVGGSAPGSQPVVFVLTSGLVAVPPAEREAEMRSRAQASQRLRALGAPRVLAGVVRDNSSHWLLHWLGREMGAPPLLVRSSSSESSRVALGAIRSKLQGARKVSLAPGSARRVTLWFTATLLALALLRACRVARSRRDAGAPQIEPLAAEVAEAEALKETQPRLWKLSARLRDQPDIIVDSCVLDTSEVALEGRAEVGTDSGATLQLRQRAPGETEEAGLQFFLCAEERLLFVCVPPGQRLSLNGLVLDGPRQEPLPPTPSAIEIGAYQVLAEQCETSRKASPRSERGSFARNLTPANLPEHKGKE